MSIARACIQCRAAKTRCDQVRPTCERCTRRRLNCSGLPAEGGLIFRDERETAQRNSERARRETSEPPPAFSFDVRPSPSPSEQPLDPSLQLQYSWLSQRMLTNVAGPLHRDLGARAVDRFFINWTVYPDNDGVSPGHMHHIHLLYVHAPPDSILWLAVRALAYADLKYETVSGTPFNIKAREYYGAALQRLRVYASEQQRLVNDQVLAAVLLIDNFELLFLSRTEALWPHRDAIRYILRTGNDDYLFDEPRFSLWCLAQKRLQSRQMLLREKPEPEQIDWMKKLNVDRPDIHVSADVLNMNSLSAAAKQLTQTGEDTEINAEQKLEKSTQLVQSMQTLLPLIDEWVSVTTGAWKPKVFDSTYTASVSTLDVPLSLPLPHLPCSYLLDYHNVWLAYVWNFHAASQIVLRESLIDVVKYAASLQGQVPDDEDLARIRDQVKAVDRLAASIIRSVPPLIGLTQGPDPETGQSRQHGKMAGRLFLVCAMWAVRRAHYASAQHRQTASEVLAWITARHGLV